MPDDKPVVIGKAELLRRGIELNHARIAELESCLKRAQDREDRCLLILRRILGESVPMGSDAGNTRIADLAAEAIRLLSAKDFRK